jgi:hypothetical protein
MHTWGNATRYAGILFRSRGEAAWAEWLTAHGFEWAYEPKRFSAGGSSSYTPDFELSPGNIFLEVKAAGQYRAMNKRADLVYRFYEYTTPSSGHPLIAVFGMPTKHVAWFMHEDHLIRSTARPHTFPSLYALACRSIRSTAPEALPK